MRVACVPLPLVVVLLSAGPSSAGAPRDPAAIPLVSVDRFSAAAGHLQVRTATNGLPGPNAPIAFDRAPFITKGFGPKGQPIAYYNFDVQPMQAAPVYALRGPDGRAVPGQLLIIDAVPGDPGYSDLHQLVLVTVPPLYRVNSVTSGAAIRSAGWPIEQSTTIINAPVVPAGSTARLRAGGAPTEAHAEWYRGQKAEYLLFESMLTGTATGTTPVSPIFVTFNRNPGTPGGGPGSGFKTESGSDQTHNVAATVPGDPGYSPLWQVSVYDNANFAVVRDLASIAHVRVLAANVATVNCPIVTIR